MTKDTVMLLHRIFNIILSVFLIISGILFCLGCLSIYFNLGEMRVLEGVFGEGITVLWPFPQESPYSPEAVAAAFLPIAVPVFITVALSVGGGIFELISPLKVKKEKPEKDYAALKKKLLTKKDLSSCDKGILKGIRACRALRTVALVARVIAVVLCSAVFLIYALNGNNFHDSDINGSMIGAMAVLAPCLIVSGGAALCVELMSKSLLKKETELLKRIPDSRAEDKKGEPDSETGALVSVIRAVFLVSAALALIVAGIYMGGYGDVLTKAVNICTECIGLG